MRKTLIEDQRVNGLKSPVGIDSTPLSFSWVSLIDGITAWQIEIKRGDALEWDSGRIEGSIPRISYSGPRLKAGCSYRWRVRGWSDDVDHGWSPFCPFETVIEDESWTAPWVSMEGILTPLFRSLQTIKIDDLKSARWYIAAGGLVEPHLNGHRLGDEVLFPPHTDYTKRIQVLSLDVTSHLREGNNVLGITLGGGWYTRHGYGPKCFRSELHLHRKDGLEVIWLGAKEWQVRSSGWTSEDIVDGESFDARIHPFGWDQDGVKLDQQWHQLGLSFGRPPNAAQPPGGRCVGRAGPPIRWVGSSVPHKMSQSAVGGTIYDFGRLLSAQLEIRGTAPPGTTVSLQFSETLDESGQPDFRSNKGARGKLHYTFLGKGDEKWHPHFSYHGFRYVHLISGPSPCESIHLVAHESRSECERRAKLNCSDPILQKLWDMSMGSIEANLFGMVTDCPQRDERQGWLADGWAITPTVLMAFDAEALFRKWCDDMFDIQDPETHLRWSATAPVSPGHTIKNMPIRTRYKVSEAIRNQPQSDEVYTAAATLVPWLLYRSTGDLEIVRRAEPFVDAHLKARVAISGHSLNHVSWHGDHSSMAFLVDEKEKAPNHLVAAAVFLMELQVARKMQRLLGLEDTWSSTIKEVGQAIQEEGYSSEKKSFGSMTMDALALDLDIAPSAVRQDLLSSLVSRIQNHEYRILSGLVSSPSLFRVLSQEGYDDVIYQMLTQPNEPGFRWMIDAGWDGLGEHLVSNWPDLSRNQPGWSLICEWMVASVVGIQFSDEVPGGFRAVIQVPWKNCPSKVNFEVKTEVGLWRIQWERVNEAFHLNILVPPNSQGEIKLKKGEGIKRGESCLLEPGESERIIEVQKENG